MQEDYLSTVPIEIEWKNFNSDLFKQVNLKDGFSDRMWLFHRGIGVDKTKDSMFKEKLDVLIIRYLTWFLQLLGLVPKFSVTEPNQPQTSSQRAIKRINLRNSVKGFNGLFKLVELQEPTFKEVIILYRKSTPPGEKKDLGIYIKTFRGNKTIHFCLLNPFNKFRYSYG